MTLLKKVIAVGCGFSLLGVVLYSLGWLLGGSFPSVRYWDGSWHVGDVAFSNALSDRLSDLSPSASSSLNMFNTAFNDFEATDLSPFQEVEAEIGAAHFVLQEGDCFSIATDSIRTRYFSQEIDEGKLKVTYRNRKNTIKKPIGHIIVTVPKGTVLEEVSLVNGVGNGEICNITCGELDVLTGVGTITISDVTAGSLEIEGGVGETVGTNIAVLKGLSVKNGVGSVSLQGDMRGEIELETGIGEIDLDFSGAIGEYQMFVPNRGLGTVTVNGRPYSSVDSQFSSYPSANRIEVENAVGEIRLSFAGETAPKADPEAAGESGKTQSVVIRSGDGSSRYSHITDPAQVSQLAAVLSDTSQWELEPLPRQGVTLVCTIELYQTPTPTVVGGASGQEELLLTAALYLEPDDDGDPDDDDWYLSFSGAMGGTYEIPSSTGEYLWEVQKRQNP